MQKRFHFYLSFIVIISIVIFSCSKFDTTDIGGDLIPGVDNIKTFDTTLEIKTTQGIFDNDSTLVSSSNDLVFGRISNDPVFGTTTANLYTQFKPTSYPFYYGVVGDTITKFDSVVLSLSYKGYWGDTLQPIQFQVKQIPQMANKWDSLYTTHDIRYAPPVSNIIGSATINFSNLSKFTVFSNKRDSINNVIRIKLDASFAQSIFEKDSTSSGAKNALFNDSAFRKFLNGIAIEATSVGNGLLYTNLSDTATRLEVHYQTKNGSKIDTSYSSFRVIDGSSFSDIPSAVANYIVRNRSGSEMMNTANTDAIYIQSTPGSYANLKIPALDSLSNRVIHRAEIIVEQIPDFSGLSYNLTPPNFLYLDLVDTTPIISSSKWKPVYFDLNPNTTYNPDNINTFFPSGGIDYGYFGGFIRTKQDAFSNYIKFYNFNITRYVQQIVTKRVPNVNNYTMRLYSPFAINYPQYSLSYAANLNRLAYGRVKVGSGTNANYKMRLRLVYSKI